MTKTPVKSRKRALRKRKPTSWVTRKPVKSTKHTKGPGKRPKRKSDRSQLIQDIAIRLKAAGYQISGYHASEEAEQLKGSKVFLTHTFSVEFRTGYDVDTLPAIFDHFHEALSGHYFGRTIASATLYSERDESEHAYSLGITETFSHVFSQMPDYIEAWLIPGQSGDRATVTGVQLACTPPHKYKSDKYDGFEPVEEQPLVKKKTRRGRKSRT